MHAVFFPSAVARAPRVAFLGGLLGGMILAQAATNQFLVEPALRGARVPPASFSKEAERVILPGPVPMDLVWIPAGHFRMGQQAGELDAYPNKETPQHEVRISRGFWMGRTEVTQGQWRALMGTSPWSGRDRVVMDDRRPAVFVSWEDARAFAERLAQVTGRPFRLPTEAEWEYGCRAGTGTRFYWGNDLAYARVDAHAWWRGNALITSEKGARPVGLKPPNRWGLCDMSGNVSEWCHDWHWFYGDGPDLDPVGPAFAAHRVLRGGSWLSTPGQCRSARRNHELPTANQSDIGFRVVCGPRPEPEPGAPEFIEVFVAGQAGVNTYRIPSLLVAPDGSLLAFAEARKESQHDASPTDLVLRRSRDGGRSWFATQILVRGVGREALMNPCPVVDRVRGVILLVCQKANQKGENHHEHVLLTSADNGVSWSEPAPMAGTIQGYDDRFNPGPGVGLQMRSGRLIIPGYAGEPSDDFDEEWYARVLYSDDGGLHWTMGPAVPELSDESQAVELRDGTLMLNMRGNMGRSCRGVALSRDGGESWSEFRWDRALNECPCQASMLRYGKVAGSGKELLLFANPDNRGEKFNVVERTHLTVRWSIDDGKTWAGRRLIHAGPASYSGLVRLPDGDVGLVFEGGEKHRREWIRFARFSPVWLTR